jgi:M6 family metalloprotease-like protein
MKKTLVFAIAICVLGSSFSSPAVAAVKPGAKCTVEGQVKNSQGKKFTCVKTGKKLAWNKGRTIQRTAPIPTPVASNESAATEQPKPAPSTSAKPETTEVSQSNANPTVASSNVEICKLKENNANRNNALFALPTGFPGTNSLATKSGTVKWALIPIDFPDMRGASNFRARVDSQMKLASEWFEVASEGKFKVEWVVADNWITLPNPSSQYSIRQSVNLGDAANGPKLFRDAMTAADPVFNFTNVQTVNFILPEGQKIVEESSQGFPWDAAVTDLKLSEGKISSFAIPGSFFDQLNRQYWSYWVHEFGHAMGIPHIGSSREPNPFMNLDIMGNQDGYAKELSGWHRFVAGWLADEKVYCQELSSLSTTELSLVPISDSKNGLKMTVVKLSETKAIVIESRRETKFSCNMPSKKNGVLAYLYDANKGHSENYFVPITPSGRADEGSSNCPVVPYPDPHLYQGQSITFEGVRIEVLESKEFDKIRLSRG